MSFNTLLLVSLFPYLSIYLSIHLVIQTSSGLRASSKNNYFINTYVSKVEVYALASRVKET